MAIAMELDGAIATPAALIDVQPLALRSYQAEMVEESLSQNVVVVMDTGSGKTYIVLKGDTHLPKILGLSASPVMKADATTQSLEQIERNLHATTKTPRKSRSELTKHVHHPELVRVDYHVDDQVHSRLVTALNYTFIGYDLMQDPYTTDLLRQQQEGVDVSGQLQRLFLSQKTYCVEQLRTLAKKAQDMLKELGPSAVDWYLHQCVAKFEKTVGDAEQLLDLSNSEKQHLLKLLKGLPPLDFVSNFPLDTAQLSQKVERLIDILTTEAQGKLNFTGLVFVEQRAWLAVLAEILVSHPRTRDLLRVGTFLGTSSSGKRKQMIANIPEPRNQKATLDDFRAGTTNLILTTSVLEEGIDVSSCHLVVCFERPKNLKSFVQRRGRARMQESKYFIFMPDAGGERPPESWEALEREMKKVYLDDMRQSHLAAENETEEEVGTRIFEVEATGARLTLDDALSHLNHFCSLLASKAYFDPRPLFKFFETSDGITAEVTLPISVDRAVRKAMGSGSWRTEKMARKDAAFEAYKALYYAGLVSENLLPLRRETDDMALGSHAPENRPSMIPSSPTLDPWLSVAKEWKQKPQVYYRALIEFPGVGNIRLTTINPIPVVDDIRLHWNERTQPTDSRLQVVRVPRRRDFLHPLLKASNANDAYTRVETLEAANCVVENLPSAYAQMALRLPSVLHKIELGMIADNLRTSLLGPVDFTPDEVPLIVRALTASSAEVEDNYQRLEFLGDCMLKFISSLHITASNPTWPANYLTVKKGQVVSNGFLARATLAAGLDQFISTKRFTGAKWSPRYWADILNSTEQPDKIERSSKLLADVVESLIGAGYVCGGLPKAFACVQTLLPLEPWTPIPSANVTLYEAAPVDIAVTQFDSLESLIGHNFNKKTLLLEALTHNSYTGPHVNSSYDRLEFFGDAVLDYIIIPRLYAHDPPLSHLKMHAIQSAMVNAAFLAFAMFETTVAEETFNKSTLQPELHSRVLWQYLRSGSPQMTAIRDMALQQHADVRERLIHALEHDVEFPWHLLALINAPKFLSDIVESVIGAIYVDSQGDLSACEEFVRRLGILDYLERILRDDVDCLHPKERLGHLAVEKSVEYVRMPLRGAPRFGDLPPSFGVGWRCQVKVGGEEVGGVVGGLNRLYSETVAAWRANEILRGQRRAASESSGDEDVFFDADEGRGVALGD
ncbi:Dicer-like protein 2 [Didymella pomorum]|uniref:Dicer-like protein 2 n=1 Tax=Didymella pomorum TaxID=749634 RepID=A0A9W9DBL7_9PLEO|nr:Dicer-like protein 2 [Didymella pomorum]